MFSSHNYLKRKTPCPGIDRKEYIQHLVDEFYTTNNSEFQEQVTANLANFAYDPLNWEYIKETDGLILYLELLQTPNEILQLNGTAGLCNICLDDEAFVFITKSENLKIIQSLFKQTENKEIILNFCTLLYYLLSLDGKQKSNILGGETLKRIKALNVLYKEDKRIGNLCSLLLEDFGKRYEFVEDPPN